MDIRLLAVSVNLTLAMVLNLFLLILSTVKYHIHTAILFTWTDYKTIFLPIVSHTRYPYFTRQIVFVDHLCLRHCSPTVTLQPSSVRGVGSAPPTHVQRIQPSTQLPRGQSCQPSVASSSIWEDLRTQSGSLALDDSPSLRASVVYL